jgi:hypothetical protein
MRILEQVCKSLKPYDSKNEAVQGANNRHDKFKKTQMNDKSVKNINACEYSKNKCDEYAHVCTTRTRTRTQHARARACTRSEYRDTTETVATTETSKTQSLSSNATQPRTIGVRARIGVKANHK